MGDPDCKVREIVDSEKAVEAIKKKTNELIEKAEQAKLDNAPKWDVALAEKMYADGKSFQEIADTVCRSRSIVANYARKHDWKRRYKKDHVV